MTGSPDRPAPRTDETGCGLIEVHLRELNQLFESLDPSPFHEKDLDPKAEEYIVESIKELPARPRYALVLTVDRPAGLPDEGRVVGDAVRAHFDRRSRLLRRQLRRLVRRGLISLAIGLAFLVAVILAAQAVGHLMGENAFAMTVRESLLIVGWVAMWRPLEIFLYDWWTIVGERRHHDMLREIDVRVTSAGRPVVNHPPPS